MDINQQLIAITKALRCNFTLRDQPIAADQVFSDAGLLPAIMKRADQLSTFCLGYGLGLSFEEAANTIQGSKVKFDDKTPNSLRVMCATDVIIEFMQNAPTRSVTPLDDLLYD